MDWPMNTKGGDIAVPLVKMYEGYTSSRIYQAQKRGTPEAPMIVSSANHERQYPETCIFHPASGVDRHQRA